MLVTGRIRRRRRLAKQWPSASYDPRATRRQRSLSPSDTARAAMTAARRRRREFGWRASRRSGLGSVAAMSAACAADNDDADLPNARRAPASAPNFPPGLLWWSAGRSPCRPGGGRRNVVISVESSLLTRMARRREFLPRNASGRRRSNFDGLVPAEHSGDYIVRPPRAGDAFYVDVRPLACRAPDQAGHFDGVWAGFGRFVG
jgi:hypothetical protein